MPDVLRLFLSVNVGMLVCVRVCVCEHPSLRSLITSGVMYIDSV